MESDSFNSVSWLSCHSAYCKGCTSSLNRPSCLQFLARIFVLREANRVADSLAKSGLWRRLADFHSRLSSLCYFACFPVYTFYSGGRTPFLLIQLPLIHYY